MLKYLLFLSALLFHSCIQANAPQPMSKKIVLIAGPKSHGPKVHEYIKTIRLLNVMLDQSNIEGLVTEVHYNGWPENETTLDDADLIMVISDSQDGPYGTPAPFMTDERMATLERQMDRGCCFITFHFSTFSPDHYGKQILDWVGGYFDWQADDGSRKWYSDIKTLETKVRDKSFPSDCKWR